jgi:hypothetical protein
MGFETDQSVVAELKLYTENDGDIYRQTTQPLLKALMAHWGRGTYDSEQAVRAFMNLAEVGARKYAREIAGQPAGWSEMFDTKIRRAAAIAWRDEFEAEAKLGNYDDLLPAKYKKQAGGQHVRTGKSGRSLAYEHGRKDAIKFADGLSERSIAGFLSNIRTNPARSFSVYLPGTRAGESGEKIQRKRAKHLGIPVSAITQRTSAYDAAVQAYDDGFERGLRSVLDAMQGN